MHNQKAPRKRLGPLFHITKRTTTSKMQALAIRVGAIVCALVLIGIVTLIAKGANPFAVYGTMFAGYFGNNTPKSLQSTAILLCIGLALTPAFKMKFWNIGAEGQVLMGCLASAACMYYVGVVLNAPTFVVIIAMLAASMLAGAIMGFLPAIFKAFFGTNETLFTLMLNSVAICLINFMANVWSPSSELPAASFFDPQNKVGSVFNSNTWWISVVAVISLSVIMYIYLNYSKHGYEISVVGESENTAKYIGVNVKKVIIRTMITSGLICGLAGFITAAFNLGVSSSDAKGYGFTAIMVAWLAKFNPLVMILSAFLFIFVSRGGQELTVIGFPKEYSEILVGILLFFIIGCEFFINYSVVPGTSVKKAIDKVKGIFCKSSKKSAEIPAEITEEKEEN